MDTDDTPHPEPEPPESGSASFEHGAASDEHAQTTSASDPTFQDQPPRPEPSSAGPATPGVRTQRIYRDPNGPIAGVATGIARFLGIDPLIVQILFVAFALVGGIGIGVYAALWLLLPTVSPRGTLVRPDSWQVVVGAGILGLMLFAGAIAIRRPGIGAIAIAFIVVGVILLSQESCSTSVPLPLEERPQPPPQYQPHPYQPVPYQPAPGQPVPYQSVSGQPVPNQPVSGLQQQSGASGQAQPIGDQPITAPGMVATQLQPQAPNRYGPPPPVAGYGTAWAVPRTQPAPYRRPPHQARPPQRPVTALTLAVAVLAAGVMLTLATFLPIASTAAWGVFALVCGGGLVVSAFYGRGAWLLLIPASIALIGMAASDVGNRVDFKSTKWSRFDWSVGEIRETVTEPEQLQDEYSIGVGDLYLDLSELTLTQDMTVRIDIGAGDGTVIVPDDTNLVLTGDIGAGEFHWFDENTSAVGGTLNRAVTVSESDPTLTIKTQLGAGELRIDNG